MIRIQYAGDVRRPIRSLPVHHHEPWIVIVYTYGRGHAIFEGESLPFRRGTVLCVPPRMPYAEKSVHGFNSAFIAADGLTFDECRVIHVERNDESVVRLAQLVVRAFNTKPRVAELLFDALLLSIPRSAPSAHPQIERLRELIHQSWSDPDFSIAAAMDEIPVSPAHLRRSFSRIMKMSPVQYLLRYRITQARRLLAVGGYSVKEISQMCGFSDPYYFSRAFRKLQDSTPSEWRVRNS
jgi:AraC-like DNA-binding protein